MEENRLRPMPEDYDKDLFNEIYKKTENLRKKLAYGIDARRFGVDYKEVLSWFDVKFIHAFRKYHDKKSPELLKAYIINALQFFKQRILRFSYSQKAQIHNTIDIQDISYLPQEPPEIDDKKILLSLCLSVMKNKISKEAYQVLLIELNPPLFILVSITSTEGKTSSTKIPGNLIADYLGWGREGIRKVSLCREEIRMGIHETKEFFAEKEVYI